MATECLYLNDTLLFECDAVVIGLRKEEDEHVVIFDRTIFYPQGGGQPADQGHIHCHQNTFNVRHVVKKEGLVEHFGSFLTSPFSVNDKVQMVINKERRIKNAKLHFAGHLLRYAFYDLGITEFMRPAGGYHFPQGPYIDYVPKRADLSKESIDQFMPSVKKKADELIKWDLKHSFDWIEPKDVPPKSKDFFAEAMMSMQSVRVGRLEGFEDCWLPCGGTHLYNTGCLEEICIDKYSFKKGVLRVSYSIPHLSVQFE